MTDQLTVLLLTGEYPPMEGGVADFTRILSRALVHQGIDVHVLTSTKSASEDEHEEAANGIAVHAIMEDWGFRSLYGSVRRLVEEIGADVINVQYQSAAYDLHPAINLLPRFYGAIPVVTTFHDLRPPYLFPKAGKLRDWVTLDLARKSALAIVTNAQDRARLQAELDDPHTQLIPIGSNISYALPEDYSRDRWRGQWGVGTRTTLLSYFGFLNESKGGEELIEALDILYKSGMNVDLMMIGGVVGASDPTNRTYLERIKQMVSEKKLRDQVFWTGYLAQPEVSAAFTSSDICLLPYRDGASFRRGSLMAALTNGAAIISTIPQIHLPELKHSENIYLVPARDPRALADAIRKVSSDDALRHQLGRGARELSKSFDWNTIAERTANAYREVVRGNAH